MKKFTVTYGLKNAVKGFNPLDRKFETVIVEAENWYDAFIKATRQDSRYNPTESFRVEEIED